MFRRSSIAVALPTTKTSSTPPRSLTTRWQVLLKTDANIGVLQSKQWFEWENESSSLLPGALLIFHIQSQISFKEKSAYRNVSVSGDIFVRNQLNPGDQFEVKIRHVGVRDGNIVVSIKTTNDRGEKVLSGSAEVSQPTTVYVFTGQGSQEPKMGMDLYNSSPAARAVWDGTHLLAIYGFSIIEIAKDNPKEKTIHFGVRWYYRGTGHPPALYGHVIRHHGQGWLRQDSFSLYRHR